MIYIYMDITKYYHVRSYVSIMSFFKMQVKLNNFYPNVGFTVYFQPERQQKIFPSSKVKSIARKDL